MKAFLEFVIQCLWCVIKSTCNTHPKCPFRFHGIMALGISMVPVGLVLYLCKKNDLPPIAAFPLAFVALAITSLIYFAIIYFLRFY